TTKRTNDRRRQRSEPDPARSGRVWISAATGLTQDRPHFVDGELVSDKRPAQQVVVLIRARRWTTSMGKRRANRPTWLTRSTPQRVPGGRAVSSTKQMPPIETLRTRAGKPSSPRRRRAWQAQSGSAR